MDLTRYKFEQFPGWPPDGQHGLFYGFDKDGNSSILLWKDGKWHGIYWRFDLGRPLTEVFSRGNGPEIVAWARAPMRYSEMCIPCEGTGRVNETTRCPYCNGDR